MDSKLSENESARPLRRSARHASGKALGCEPTPRGPLKRTKKSSESPDPPAAVNGSGDKDNGSEDEGHFERPFMSCTTESPRKKGRLETGGAVGGGGDENEMDVQQSTSQDQDMDTERQESSHGSHPPKISHGTTGDVNYFPRVVLRECGRSHAANEDADLMKAKRVNPSTKGSSAPTKSAVQIRSLVNSHDVPILNTSMAEYKSRMEAIAKRSGYIPTVNNVTPKGFPPSEKYCTTRQRLKHIPIKKEPVQQKKQERKKKTDVIKKSSTHSSRGFMWYFGCLVLLVLLSSALLLAYKKIPVLRRVADRGGHLSRAVQPDLFADQLSRLEAKFPSQRPELWRRSKIHLEKHLRTAQPKEPVSLIFTAGRGAESTLRCLAQGLASAFSSALNASVLQIDGVSKASQDSNEVKLDIDGQLKEAFEGDKPVAVIHRLEELPPGSTLIFYRYCDHENAAYKQVFLLFTVLLPQDEVSSEQSLKGVEEMVQDYVKERLVGSSGRTSFSEMDVNKYSGLWSRISHLILPVASEKEVEQKGC
ncbi:putative torsin-1A-interacting protein 2-like [Scophthalmus maximus]|uniref:Putative torsin-1A-interacting protein 2-like n=1 Tax=Scophthalmus maximus TaxID=52904 RepID=A0A2U9C3N1_SCOMX|nr:torsin-1A-interacting protein 2 isoform X1 [Scophthalmus maximus]AWP11018.1 putative torsin-1A-interacting protein 2-like [Scophthalmus maximus]